MYYLGWTAYRLWDDVWVVTCLVGVHAPLLLDGVRQEIQQAALGERRGRLAGPRAQDGGQRRRRQRHDLRVAGARLDQLQQLREG